MSSLSKRRKYPEDDSYGRATGIGHGPDTACQRLATSSEQDSPGDGQDIPNKASQWNSANNNLMHKLGPLRISKLNYPHESMEKLSPILWRSIDGPYFTHELQSKSDFYEYIVSVLLQPINTGRLDEIGRDVITDLLDNIERRVQCWMDIQVRNKKYNIDLWKYISGILPKILSFCNQLLYMKNVDERRNVDIESEHFGRKSLPEGMYQALFQKYVNIFDLQIHGQPNILPSQFDLTVCGSVVKCVPDGIVVSRRNDTCIIVEVKSEHYEVEDNNSFNRTQEIISENIPHLPSSLEGQLTAELLSGLQESVFRSSIFGFAIQGTEVTFASLSTKGNYLENLKHGQFSRKDSCEIKFSDQCNFLMKTGRQKLHQLLWKFPYLIKKQEEQENQHVE